jgi:hypothetical protein
LELGVDPHSRGGGRNCQAGYSGFALACWDFMLCFGMIAAGLHAQLPVLMLSSSEDLPSETDPRRAAAS